MEPYRNVHGFQDTAAGREGARLLNQALSFSKRPAMADQAGNLAEAVAYHQRALEPKIRLFTEESTQAALTFNEVGECYLKLNDLPAAEEALTKALRARDNRSHGGLEHGPRSVLASAHAAKSATMRL